MKYFPLNEYTSYGLIAVYSYQMACIRTILVSLDYKMEENFNVIQAHGVDVIPELCKLTYGWNQYLPS